MGKKENDDLLKVIEEHTRKIVKDPNNIDYYIDRGDAYYCLKEYEKAFEDYSHVLEINPNCEEAEDLKKLISGDFDSNFKKHRNQEQLDNF